MLGNLSHLLYLQVLFWLSWSSFLDMWWGGVTSALGQNERGFGKFIRVFAAISQVMMS